MGFRKSVISRFHIGLDGRCLKLGELALARNRLGQAVQVFNGFFEQAAFLAAFHLLIIRQICLRFFSGHVVAVFRIENVQFFLYSGRSRFFH